MRGAEGATRALPPAPDDDRKAQRGHSPLQPRLLAPGWSHGPPAAQRPGRYHRPALDHTPGRRHALRWHGVRWHALRWHGVRRRAPHRRRRAAAASAHRLPALGQEGGPPLAAVVAAGPGDAPHDRRAGLRRARGRLPSHAHPRAGRLRRRPDDDDLLLRRGHRDGHARGAEPRHPRRCGHPPARQGRRRRGRGPDLLRERRHQHHRHGQGCVGHADRRGPTGRLVDHPAVRRALLLQRDRRHHPGQDPGDVAGDQAQPGPGQGPDHLGVPQHHLLRPRLLRHRDRCAVVLRCGRRGADRLAGCAHRRRHPVAEQLRPARVARAGRAALELRARRHGGDRSADPGRPGRPGVPRDHRVRTLGHVRRAPGLPARHGRARAARDVVHHVRRAAPHRIPDRHDHRQGPAGHGRGRGHRHAGGPRPQPARGPRDAGPGGRRDPRPVRRPRLPHPVAERRHAGHRPGRFDLQAVRPHRVPRGRRLAEVPVLGRQPVPHGGVHRQRGAQLRQLELREDRPRRGDRQVRQLGVRADQRRGHARCDARRRAPRRPARRRARGSGRRRQRARHGLAAPARHGPGVQHLLRAGAALRAVHRAHGGVPRRAPGAQRWRDAGARVRRGRHGRRHPRPDPGGRELRGHRAQGAGRGLPRGGQDGYLERQQVRVVHRLHAPADHLGHALPGGPRGPAGVDHGVRRVRADHRRLGAAGHLDRVHDAGDDRP